MEIMLKEIISLIKDCEKGKPLREAEKIRMERQCYEDIKAVIEPLMSKEEEHAAL